MIELRKITLLDEEMKDCIALTIPKERRDYVDSYAVILSLVFEFDRRNLGAGAGMRECRAIYADGKMIGLFTFDYSVNSRIFKEACYRIQPFAIDRDAAGLRYEQAAVTALIDEFRKKPLGEATAVFATYHPDEKDMAELFENIGFVKTDFDWSSVGQDSREDIIARFAI